MRLSAGDVGRSDPEGVTVPTGTSNAKGCSESSGAKRGKAGVPTHALAPAGAPLTAVESLGLATDLSAVCLRFAVLPASGGGGAIGAGTRAGAEANAALRTSAIAAAEPDRVLTSSPVSDGMTAL